MANCAEFEKERERYFLSLLDMSWDGKHIWEHIRDGNLSATPAFEGELYQNKAKRKIMFVGRDLNGWDEPLGDCSTLENTVSSVLSQQGALDTFVNKEGCGNNERKYYHKHSKFLRFIKHILEELGESDPDIEKTFYDDSKRWNQRFVWANLYCISPRNPESSESAHPDNAMIKAGINEYVDLMKLYIEHYQPDVVVFVTDIYGWFIRWTRQKSFRDIVSGYREIAENNTIVASGMVGKSRIIICRRPDRRGTSYQDVIDMAKDVAGWVLQGKEKKELSLR